MFAKEVANPLKSLMCPHPARTKSTGINILPINNKASPPRSATRSQGWTWLLARSRQPSTIRPSKFACEQVIERIAPAPAEEDGDAQQPPQQRILDAAIPLANSACLIGAGPNPTSRAP